MPAPSRPLAAAAAVVAVCALPLTGCAAAGGGDRAPGRSTTVAAPQDPTPGTTPGTTQDPTPGTTPGTTPRPAPGTTPAAAGTPVVLTIDGTPVPGLLRDNPAARDLASRLPLTLTFADFDGVEKIAALDPPLTMAGMPAGDDPAPGEIGWYAPSGDLVLYYGDVGYWTGIARLGTVDDAATDLLAAGPRDVTVTLAAAGG